MHNLIAIVLILFSGWTLSAQLAVILGLSLNNLIVLAPAAIFVAAILYLRLAFPKAAQPFPGIKQECSTAAILINQPPVPVLLWLFLVPFILYLSWLAFWISSLLVLLYYSFKQGSADKSASYGAPKLQRNEYAVVLGFCIGAVLLTLAVSRSDMDDAFYVAVAAFSSGHPDEPLLAFDPMHVERSWPLIFPSYRFATFELFGGALAHLSGISSMDAMYRILPPFWAVITVLCIFLYAQELMPRRWLLLGTITILFTVILGEAHRAPANFTFVRMFQGKAVYLSAIMPAIFYLTARYLSPKGTSADVFLLGCAQITAIGLSNFAMLAAPMAGVGALLSNYTLFNQQSKKKIWCVLVTLSVSLPYLLSVMFSSQGVPSLSHFETELPSTVWKSVLGWRQHYLVAVLLLVGPIMAGDSLLRRRLAVPMLLLFAIYLNPWLSPLISRFITTPPVYWRVMWSFPVLTAAAAGLCLIIEYILQNKVRGKALRIFPLILSAIVLTLLALSVPFHTLRSDNDIQWDFAGKKISPSNYQVAQTALSTMKDNAGRMLAPDEISGIVTMFENHPKLVNARGLYIEFLSPAMDKHEYEDRAILHRFVSGVVEPGPAVRLALNSMKVNSIVIQQSNDSPETKQLLEDERFRRIETINGYGIWFRITH
jgi:hypothetical protein